MNKKELIAEMAKEAKLSQKDTTALLNSLLANIEESLQSHEGINLQGFGTFKVSYRSPRTCKNLKTGEEVFVDAKSVPAFTAAKSLKEDINNI